MKKESNTQLKFFRSLALFTALSAAIVTTSCDTKGEKPLSSFETPYTIESVRIANIDGKERIVASTPEGILACFTYEGEMLWENKLSGFYNHDICCYDIDGDLNDEILVANADGTLFYLDERGDIIWSFKQNDVPLYSVCAYYDNGEKIIATGGLDKNIYLLSPQKELLQTIPSVNYARTKGWADQEHTGRDGYQGSTNFLRTIKDSDGSDIVALVGTVNSNNTNGGLYLLDIDLQSSTPEVLKYYSNLGGDPLGSFATLEREGERDRILLGPSGMKMKVVDVDTQSDETKIFDIMSIGADSEEDEGLIDRFGYRIIYTQTIPDEELGYRYFVLAGSRILLLNPDFSYDKSSDIIINKFSFNDICKDSEHRMILASAQSGGSSIHILNPQVEGWKEAISQLTPKGKISQIIENSNTLRKQLESFSKPLWEREQTPVYFMSESVENPIVAKYVGKYKSPTFLNGYWMSVAEDPKLVKRDTMSSVIYRNKRDKRKKYTASPEQMINSVLPEYEGYDGASYWGGHGNDPYFYSFQTLKRILTDPKTQGKTTVLIYPELQDESDEFQYVMKTLITPLAELSREIKREDDSTLKLYMRTKNIFWHSAVYNDAWKDLVSGKYADIYVPSLEETSSRTMEMSIAARLGLWQSNSVESWGSRCARDNPSHDRLRQRSHQMLPNHFLRNMVYHLSLGAQYIDNFAVDQEYMSILWDLIGEGLLYVPRREELVSLSPVQIAMTKADHDFIREGVLGKWTVLYDQEEAKSKTPMVFDRMSVTWTTGVINEWDYSYYAAGVKDRRSSFLAPFSKGLVMIAPAQESSPYRGKITEYMHPLYRDITKRYITDGKYYYVDGKKMAADSYYKVVKSDIDRLSKCIPLTVDGEVAWVTAQSAEKHLRLTIIDGGYLNPSTKEAKITFNTIQPIKITDLASGKEVKFSGNEATVTIPTGLFRFFDIELAEAL